MPYCDYYQARVIGDCWFFVGVLRSFEHLSFDRTLDKKTSRFEIFVPPSSKDIFLELMDYFLAGGIIEAYEQLPNRLKDPDATL